MWTSYFIVLVVALLIVGAMAYVELLFGRRRACMISLRWAAGLFLAAAYCCWRAFW